MMMVQSLRWISRLAGLGVALAGCSGTDDGSTGNTAGTTSGASGGAPSAAGAGATSGSAPRAGSGSGGASSAAGSGGGGSSSTGGMAGGGGAAAGSGSSTAGAGGSAAGGGAGGGAGSGASGSSGSGGGGSGTCTASKSVSTKTGSGSHGVTIETNADPGIKEGTIYRPTDLGAGKKYPIFVWGNGACSKNGLSNQAAMVEIASQGYFVIADGTPNGSGNRDQTGDVAGMAKPLIAYIDWAIAENGKACSAYSQSLDTTKVGANGFSCGGLMSEGTAGDPRVTTWGVTSSGMTGTNANFYKTIHTPVLLIEGGTSDIAYENGARDYENISKLDFPLMWFSKNIGHGGDLGSSKGGDFTRINLAWMNWWLKGDEGATGKGVLVGAGCSYCTDNAWEVKSAHLP